MEIKRIAIVSDSHGLVLDQTAQLIRKEHADFILFLGDHYQDGLLLQRKTGLDGLSVLGNNDYQLYGQAKLEDCLELYGYRIHLCHGHSYGVHYGLDRLHRNALKNAYDICLFGHTHVYLHEQRDGIHFFNPGSPSICKYSFHPRSFAILDLAHGINFEKVIVDTEDKA